MMDDESECAEYESTARRSRGSSRPEDYKKYCSRYLDSGEEDDASQSMEDDYRSVYSNSSSRWSDGSRSSGTRSSRTRKLESRTTSLSKYLYFEDLDDEASCSMEA